MTYFITGVAGFIGFHVAQHLLARGEKVVGIDNLSNFYASALKKARLNALAPYHNAFRFIEGDIADKQTLDEIKRQEHFDKIIHLAAQPGVRYSIDHPEAYVSANLSGHLNMLELARHLDGLERMVYASSSSVYGGNTNLPFSEADPVEHPVSLYAATKRADELMSEAYAHLYDVQLTGLRFFTVYGPWGRPDMAVWRFTKAIVNNQPIQIYSHGHMKRDFTYIDDIVTGIIATIDETPRRVNTARHCIYNIGNHRSEALMDLIGFLEEALGKTAQKEFLPHQPGDVKETFADITSIGRDYGFQPVTLLQQGVKHFVEWFLAHKAQRY